MGGSSYSHDEYKSRAVLRTASAIPVFKHDADVKAGKVRAGTEPRMNPKGAIRECRDSDAHPVTLPVMVMMDTTGSMQEVPKILEASLPKLMGAFLDDKASGKKYLGDAYPSILVGALDDYDAMYRHDHDGTLQVGQFESGIEIDEDLEKIWLTGNGGGTYHESYELAMFFASRRTSCDHFEKRGKKGYLFLIGDEHAYPKVKGEEVEAVIGVKIQGDILTEDMVKEAQKKWNIFFILPNLTSHYDDDNLQKYWMKLLGQQNVIRLEDPARICECIASCVAICEGNADLDDLVDDGVASGLSEALVLLSKGAISKVSADALPVISGPTPSVERL